MAGWKSATQPGSVATTRPSIHQVLPKAAASLADDDRRFEMCVVRAPFRLVDRVLRSQFPRSSEGRVIEAGATPGNAHEPCGYYPSMDHDRDQAMTRSEEELAVDTVWRPAERVRVRRRVVEEEVMVTVTVRREELEIEREPASRFDPPRRDAGEPAEALVMVLHEERPVVGVEVVPTEVVRVRRAVVRGGERTVSDTVRREQIEVEGAEIRQSQS